MIPTTRATTAPTMIMARRAAVSGRNSPEAARPIATQDPHGVDRRLAADPHDDRHAAVLVAPLDGVGGVERAWPLPPSAGCTPGPAPRRPRRALPLTRTTCPSCGRDRRSRLVAPLVGGGRAAPEPGLDDGVDGGDGDPDRRRTGSRRGRGRRGPRTARSRRGGRRHADRRDRRECRRPAAGARARRPCARGRRRRSPIDRRDRRRGAARGPGAPPLLAGQHAGRAGRVGEAGIGIADQVADDGDGRCGREQPDQRRTG